MRYIFLKIIPYVSLILFSGLFFGFSIYSANHKYFDSWFLAISANLFSVFVVFFFYEIIRTKAEKELKKELFYYAKTKVDPDILVIIIEITKILFGFKKARSINQDEDLRNATLDYIQNTLKDRKILGFQLFKLRSEALTNISTVLENNFVLSRLDDRQILILIKIINSLRRLEGTLLQKGLVEKIERAEGYDIVSSAELGPYNKEFPNRHLLLKRISGDKSVVEDFGDFSSEYARNLKELLHYYRIKPDKVTVLALTIQELLGWITKWHEKTGRGLFLG